MQHAKFNSNTFFNRLNGLPVPRGDELHVRRPHRRSDHPAGLSTAAARRSSSSTRKRSTRRSRRARTRTMIRAVGARRQLHATARPARRRRVNVLALAAANGQIVGATTRRSRRCSQSIRTAAGHDRHDHGSRDEPEHGGATTTWCPNKTHPSHADDAHHGEPDAEAPPAGLVLLAALQQHAGHAEQRRRRRSRASRRSATSRRTGRPASMSLAVDVLVDHRERSARRLAVVAGRLLRQRERRHVRQPGRLTTLDAWASA